MKTHPIGQGSPADSTHKLVGVVLLLVLVQDALHCVKLECQQCLGKSFVVQVQGVVFTACRSAHAQESTHEHTPPDVKFLGCYVFSYTELGTINTAWRDE